PRKAATRNAYGEALLELGASNPDVVVLDADLSGSTKTKAFGKAHPERFFNMGVAEANMIGVAAGLASQGKVAFASSFAMFATGKAFEQIRQSVCVPELNVKICATHAGLTVGEDGKSHQMLEDVTIMRVIPGMQVIVPADAVEAHQAVLAAADIPGPVYVRLSRASTPVVFSEDYRFEFGRAAMLREGGDLAIVAMGVTVAAALEAADTLSTMGIEARVLNMSTISPVDSGAIERAARDCGAILTAEEHQENGGLGEAVAQAVVRTHPVPMEMCGMNGSFGQSGTGDELLAHYGLDAAGLVARAQQLLKRKKA
ncbi:MAG: transketolase family protein, partial [Planctomycetota bacterium]